MLIARDRTTGTETSLVPCSDCADAILSDGTYVYYHYNAKNQNNLYRVHIAGDAPQSIADAWPFTTALIDDLYVYGYDDARLVRVPKNGGSIEEVATLTEAPPKHRVRLLLDEDAIYWTRWDGRLSQLMKLKRPKP